MKAMAITKDSVHFKILACLCEMPRPVRGMAQPMLIRRFGDNQAIDDLAKAGLIEARGWADGPGWIWIPTPLGLAQWQVLAKPDVPLNPL